MMLIHLKSTKTFKKNLVDLRNVFMMNPETTRVEFEAKSCHRSMTGLLEGKKTKSVGDDFGKRIIFSANSHQ